MTASRIQHIQPFHVMALLARARELEAAGRDIVHMEIGEPDFPTPEPIVRAGIDALESGKTHYTPAAGLPALREALAGYYRSEYGVTVAPERILITPGASGALQLVLLLLVGAGDRLLMTDPGYPCNRNFVHAADGYPDAVPVNADSRYQLTPQLLKEHWREDTVGALVASPSNPTGTILEPSEIEALFQAVRQRGGHLIVDEIYHGLVYGDRAATALACSSEIFVINSFSKYFGMTGWRLGWMVAPERYVESLEMLAQNLFLAAPTPAQYAALAAFSDDTRVVLDERRDAFRERRDFLLPALRSLGFDVPVTPAGAFYLYADCSRFSQDSFALCGELLEQHGVAITPGIDFGKHRATTSVRFAYTTSVERLKVAVARLDQALSPV